MKYPRPPFNQPKFYDGMGPGNSINPMRGGYNNPMGYQNRPYNQQQGFNPMNRYPNQGNEYRPHNYQNQYNPNRNMMPYQQRQNRNPMFNPMNNPMNPPQNQMGYNQQNQYQNNQRYPPYQDRGNNQGGYQQ